MARRKAAATTLHCRVRLSPLRPTKPARPSASPPRPIACPKVKSTSGLTCTKTPPIPAGPATAGPTSRIPVLLHCHLPPDQSRPCTGPQRTPPASAPSRRQARPCSYCRGIPKANTKISTRLPHLRPTALSLAGEIAPAVATPRRWPLSLTDRFASPASTPTPRPFRR